MSAEGLDWTDVRFDQAAARQAAEECERAARLLRETTSRRRGLAGSALVNGNGPWRDQLVAQLEGLDQRSAALDAKLRGLASTLLDASVRAKAEQSRRETARVTGAGHGGTDSVPP